MATSFLLQNLAFLVWAQVQAHIQEEEVHLLGTRGTKGTKGTDRTKGTTGTKGTMRSVSVIFDIR